MSRSLPARAALAATALCVTALLLASPGGAQAPVARPAAEALTLDGALALARARSPLVRVAAARRAATAARARQDAAWPNPLVEWRRENLGAALPPDEFLTVTTPLDLTGRRFALRAAAGAAAARARADSVVALRHLDVQVARAYWRAALAGELAALAAEQRDALDGLAGFDAARLQQGAVAENVALRTRLEADRAQLAAASAEAEQERARAELARLLALAPDSVPALAPIALPTDATPVRRSRAALAGPALDTAVAAALAARPELAALRAAVAEARDRLAAERRGVLGDVQLTGGAKTTSGVRNTGVVAVTLPFPLLNRNEAGRERARAELQAVEAELADAEALVRADAAAAVRTLDRLATAGRTAGASLDRRGGEVAAIARAAYREGGMSQLEVLEAQRARAEVRAAALRWAVDVRLAELELARATGAPIAP